MSDSRYLTPDDVVIEFYKKHINFFLAPFKTKKEFKEFIRKNREMKKLNKLFANLFITLSIPIESEPAEIFKKNELIDTHLITQYIDALYYLAIGKERHLRDWLAEKKQIGIFISQYAAELEKAANQWNSWGKKEPDQQSTKAVSITTVSFLNREVTVADQPDYQPYLNKLGIRAEDKIVIQQRIANDQRIQDLLRYLIDQGTEHEASDRYYQAIPKFINGILVACKSADYIKRIGWTFQSFQNVRLGHVRPEYLEIMIPEVQKQIERMGITAEMPTVFPF